MGALVGGIGWFSIAPGLAEYPLFVLDLMLEPGFGPIKLYWGGGAFHNPLLPLIGLILNVAFYSAVIYAFLRRMRIEKPRISIRDYPRTPGTD